MKRLLLVPFALPAFAHDGAHIHPHGFEGAILAVIAVGVIYLIGRAR